MAETKLLSMTAVYPMPLIEQAERERRVRMIKESLNKWGLEIAKEGWIHNPAFDKRGEKTTLKLKLKPQQK